MFDTLIQRLLVLALVAAVQAGDTSYHVVAGDIAPFSFREGGNIKGIAVDILHAVEHEGGAKFDIDVMSWTRAQALAQQGGAYLIVPLTRTPERESHYRWIAPLYSYAFVIATTSTPSPKKQEDARHLSIVTLKNNAIASSLAKYGLDNVGFSDTEEINARRLHMGASQAWLVADLVAPYVYHRAGFDPTELHLSKFDVGERWSVELAASPDFPEADIARLRASLERIRQSGEIDRILQRYR